MPALASGARVSWARAAGLWCPLSPRNSTLSRERVVSGEWRVASKGKEDCFCSPCFFSPLATRHSPLVAGQVVLEAALVGPPVAPLRVAEHLADQLRQLRVVFFEFLAGIDPVVDRVALLVGVEPGLHALGPVLAGVGGRVGALPQAALQGGL